MDNKSYKISIVIPVYNMEKYIIRTLESIVNQTFDNYEIIIVNDGSTDNTVNVIESYLSNYNSSYSIFNQNNMGVSKARNRGINEATGEFLMFLDGDDYLSHDFFEVMIEKITSSTSDLVYCGGDVVTPKEELVSAYSTKFEYLNDDITGKHAANMMLKEKIWIYIGNALYRKKIVEENGIKFPSTFSQGEDQEFIIKFLHHSNKVSCVNKTLFYYVTRNNSATSSITLDRFEVVDMFYKLNDYLTHYGNEENVNYIYNVRIPKERISIIYLFAKHNSTLKKKNMLELDSLIKNEFKRYLKAKEGNLKFKVAITLYMISPKMFNVAVNFANVVFKGSSP